MGGGRTAGGSSSTLLADREEPSLTGWFGTDCQCDSSAPRPLGRIRGVQTRLLAWDCGGLGTAEPGVRDCGRTEAF